MTNVDFPLHFDGRHLTATAADDDHVRDLIQQLLFTSAGERVMRPTFGTGVMQLVFAGNSDELAAAVRFLIEGALQTWLSDLIVVQEIGVEARDSILLIEIRYVNRRTSTIETARTNSSPTAAA